MRPIEVRKGCPALKSQRNVIAMSERSVQSSENAGISKPMSKHQGRGLCVPGSGSRPASSPGVHGCCYDRSGGGPESGIPGGSNQSERRGQAVSVGDPRGSILRDEGVIPASSRGGGGNPCPSRVAPPRAGGLALGLKKKKCQRREVSVRGSRGRRQRSSPPRHLFPLLPSWPQVQYLSPDAHLDPRLFLLQVIRRASLGRG